MESEGAITEQTQSAPQSDNESCVKFKRVSAKVAQTMWVKYDNI